MPSGKRKPVYKDKVPNGSSEWDITVRMVLRMPDVDRFCLTVNIRIFQMAEFVKPHASGIKDGDGEISLGIVKGAKETADQFPVRDKRKVSVELTERDLGTVPWLMEHINPEKLEM